MTPKGEHSLRKMKIMHSVIGRMLFAVLLLVVIFPFRINSQTLPPHEFAYGIALKTSGEIPERMDQFLSLAAC
jgi:hypothetical protein